MGKKIKTEKNSTNKGQHPLNLTTPPPAPTPNATNAELAEAKQNSEYSPVTSPSVTTNQAPPKSTTNTPKAIDPAALADALIEAITNMIEATRTSTTSSMPTTSSTNNLPATPSSTPTSTNLSASRSRASANSNFTANLSSASASTTATSASSYGIASAVHSPTAPTCTTTAPELVDLFSTYADLFIFQLDDAVVENIFIGTILSMEPTDFLAYFQKAYLRNHCKSDLEDIEDLLLLAYNHFLFQLMTNIKKASEKKDFLKRLIQSYRISEEERCTPCALSELVRINNKTCLPELHPQLKACFEAALLTYVYRSFALKLTEFQFTVGQKLGYLEKDLIFLSTEITRLSRADAGITQIASALSLSTAARFAEDNNYDKIFRAVEEVAETIKDLAKIYQERLKLLNTLLPLSLTPRLTTEDTK